MSLENENENKNKNENGNIYVKNSVDYSSYGHDEEIDVMTNSDCLDLLDDCIEEDEIQKIPLIDDVDELAILGFFNEFTLVDIGMAGFIREVYFED